MHYKAPLIIVNLFSGQVTHFKAGMNLLNPTVYFLAHDQWAHIKCFQNYLTTLIVHMALSYPFS